MKALVSWSSGKDSALALYHAKKSFEVVGLFTTLSESSKRIGMHEVPEELLDAQCESLGLPLTKIFLPNPCTNQVYEDRLTKALLDWKSRGVTHIVFGDLYLKDIREYREAFLSTLGLTPVFPLWNQNTKELANQILALGFKAVVTNVDPKALASSHIGEEFDSDFLKSLPMNVDPCGENGEFHTFVYDGPIFRHHVEIPKTFCWHP